MLKSQINRFEKQNHVSHPRSAHANVCCRIARVFDTLKNIRMHRSAPLFIRAARAVMLRRARGEIIDWGVYVCFYL